MTEPAETSTDISFSEIFWRLWSGRGIIIFAPLLAAGLAALYVGLTALQQSQQVTYMVALRNIENQRYPSGVEFAPQDLLIPDVLSALRERFNLPRSVDLRSAITVNYDSPIAAGIARRYQDQLSVRGLSSAEITALNETYLAQLRSAVSSSVRVSVDYVALGVGQDVGLAVARAVPELWSTIYPTRFRIFSDRRIANFGISRSDENLSSTTSVMIADTRVNTMRSGLEQLVEDNRLALLRTEDGASAVDLQVQLQQFEAIWFNPIRLSYLTGTDAISQSYLNQLRVNVADLNRQVEAFDASLSELRDYTNPSSTASADRLPAQGDPSTAVQIGDSTVATILSLAGRTNFTALVEDILKQRREKAVELSRLTRQLELIASTAETPALSVPSDFRATATERLKEVTAQYGNLLATAENQLRTDGGALYEPLLGPMVTGNILSLRNILIVGVATIAAALLSIMGVLLWSGIKPRRD